MRFENATEDVRDLMNELIKENFPELTNAKIKPIFDLKKRTSKGGIVLGRFQKVNDLDKLLTEDEVEDGFDYFLYVDKKAWEMAEDEDKVRLIRHELRHSDVDLDLDKPYGLRGHDIEDFEEEIRLNGDNMRWAQRLADITRVAYEQERDND